MVIVKIWGGLGNQLFQYATAMALAERRGDECKVDLSWFSARRRSVATPRDYGLASVSLQPKEITVADTLRVRLSRFGKYAGALRVIKERDSAIPDAALDPTFSVYLDGYWQSHENFERLRNRLTKNVGHDVRLNRSDQLISQEMLSSESVAVHVRRGDYVSDASAKLIHGVPDSQYYSAALGVVSERLATPKFFFFSDDIEYCKREFGWLKGACFVSGHGDRTAADFVLMKSCRHHIIANSTYSWWAAYLGASEAQIVIAPNRWFAAPHRRPQNLVPRGWLRL